MSDVAQRIALSYSATDEPWRLRTATSFRYIVAIAYPEGALVKWGSSNNVATATRVLDRAMRRQTTRRATGVVVDLAHSELVAQQSGPDVARVEPLQLVVTGEGASR